MVIFSFHYGKLLIKILCLEFDFSRYTKKMINKNYSYKEVTKLILAEQKKISNPSLDDISAISKNFLQIDKEIVREVLGYKDEYDFIDNINE